LRRKEMYIILVGKIGGGGLIRPRRRRMISFTGKIKVKLSLYRPWRP
jgi:hypothetical protein